MSFYINNTELKEAYFNGSEVKSIYYNNTLVWEEAIVWPTGDCNWETATWKDIYDLCKAKQAGTITEWPEDVVLGATKTLSLSTAVLGTSSTTMRIIGLDHDGAGTITFQTVNTLANTTKWASGADTPAAGSWSGSKSLVRSYCSDFYNYCEAKSYIKSVSKKTYFVSSASASKYQTTSETAFLLSQVELTGSGTYSEEGSIYAYFNTTANRKKNAIHWLRTTKPDSYSYAARASTAGAVTFVSKASSSYQHAISPCFVIG